MSRKHFLGDPAALLDGMCRAVVAQNPFLKFDKLNKVVFREDANERVKLISGGGSGHEPAHAGYVGQGMLDAAVCGQIFASPNVGQILKGLQHIDNPAGIVVIVKNYTGDKLNFGLAAEEFRAKTGTPVRTILVADDVAVPRTQGLQVGRRGLAGTVFVHKIAGAASELGRPLEEVVKLGQYVSDNLATIGVSLDHCSVPGQEVHSLKGSEIELGMGIHNEPGVETLSPQPDLHSLLDRMLDHIFDSNDKERAFVNFESELSQAKVAVLVNNLGGLSVLELSAISQAVLDQLKSRYNLRPLRLYVGTYLTSLDGAGFSVSVMNLGSQANELLPLLDKDTPVAAWSSSAQSGSTDPIDSAERIVSSDSALPIEPAVRIPADMALFSKIVKGIQTSAREQEPEITKYDTLMGDGDCGTTLLAGADAVVKETEKSKPEDLSTALLSTASTARDAMGGTSGAIYGLYLGALAAALQDGYTSKKELDISVWAGASRQALDTLQGFTAARQGSRTLMDSLIPFVEKLTDAASNSTDGKATLEKAVQAARDGAENTKTMKSTFGRSAYVGAQGDGQTQDVTKGLPDPGALGIVAVLEGVLSAL